MCVILQPLLIVLHFYENLDYELGFIWGFIGLLN